MRLLPWSRFLWELRNGMHLSECHRPCKVIKGCSLIKGSAQGSLKFRSVPERAGWCNDVPQAWAYWALRNPCHWGKLLQPLPISVFTQRMRTQEGVFDFSSSSAHHLACAEQKREELIWAMLSKHSNHYLRLWNACAVPLQVPVSATGYPERASQIFSLFLRFIIFTKSCLLITAWMFIVSRPLRSPHPSCVFGFKFLLVHISWSE